MNEKRKIDETSEDDSNTPKSTENTPTKINSTTNNKYLDNNTEPKKNTNLTTITNDLENHTEKEKHTEIENTETQTNPNTTDESATNITYYSDTEMYLNEIDIQGTIEIDYKSHHKHVTVSLQTSQ